MDFRDDERGQPVLIGFILLFAMLVVAFAGYQAYVVPGQNAAVEFDHAQQLEAEFSAFGSNVVNAVESGDRRATSLNLGTGYPARLLALNPSPVAGTLETTEPGNVSITVGGKDRSTDVCGANDDGETFSQSLVYSPGYSEYQNAGATVYEHTFVGRQFQDGGSVYGDQRFVRDDRIDLVLVTGSVSESRTGAFGVEVDASHRYQYGEVENATIAIPSQFNATVWEEEILGDREDIEVRDREPDSVELEFDGGFKLSCAVAGLNGEPAFVPPRDGEDEPTFETRWIEADGEPIEGDTVTTSNDSVTLTVLATEDGTNTPIEDAAVDFAIEGEQDVGSWVYPGESQRTGVGQEPDHNTTTIENGTAQLEVEVHGGAGDEFQVYVTAGDDSDVLTVEVEG